MSNDAPEVESRPSVCPLDCADTCSLDVAVEAGRVTAVGGNNDNPFTRGKLCAKVTQSLVAQVHGPDRILTPLRRIAPGTSDDSFEAISWSDALDTIYERFTHVIDRWGAEAIAPLCYGGPMGKLANGSMDARFFHRLGASKVDSSPLCAGTSSAAWEAIFGDAGGIDFEEMAESQLIIVWGNNITTCNLHLTTLIRDAQKRGAVLVVIDPKRTRVARGANLHIPLLPGTDVVLAYAVAAILDQHGAVDTAFVEEYVHGADKFLGAARERSLGEAAKLCGVEPALIERFAQLLMERRPASMSLGVAPERNRNGGSGIRAALSLLALTGNIGPVGAGPCDVSRYFPINTDALARPDLAPRGLREFNVLDLPRKILNPGPDTPIKALFVYNHNPVAVHPEQTLMREALMSQNVFVVGSELSMTDSMRCADLVLPATSHLEYDDLYTAYGHRYLQRSHAAIEPQGEALSNMVLFRRLAHRFGFTDPCFEDSDEDLIRQAFSDENQILAVQSAKGAVDMAPFADAAMLRGTPPTTPSGKIELYSDVLEAHNGEGLPSYKPLPEQGDFILVTPASEKRINSTFGSIERQQQDIRCEINREDAKAHGVQSGDRVALQNERGRVELLATVSDDIRPGTLYVPKGAWIGDAKTGATVNALIPGHKADLAGGACYYDCTVALKRIG